MLIFVISPTEGWGYIGLDGLLGVSLRLTLPSSCSVRYLRPQFGYNSEKCETPSPCVRTKGIQPLLVDPTQMGSKKSSQQSVPSINAELVDVFLEE